jgi:hypothetical protein
VAIPLAILDTALGDIRGLPFLAGLALATLWLVRDGAVQPSTCVRPENSGPSARARKLSRI